MVARDGHAIGPRGVYDKGIPCDIARGVQLRRAHLETEIWNNVAACTLQIEWVNASESLAEATYYLPMTQTMLFTGLELSIHSAMEEGTNEDFEAATRTLEFSPGVGLPGRVWRNAQPAWRKVSSLQIQQALCFKERRTVAKDNTISFDATVFHIPKASPFRSHANKRIDVHVLLNGAVELFYQKQKIATFDSKTTHTLGLYRTNGKREGFRYGPISSLTTHDTKLSP